MVADLKADEVVLVDRSCVRPAEGVNRGFERRGGRDDGGSVGVEEEQIDVPGRAVDQAPGDERGTAGDREAGALGQAEEQAGGGYLNWRERGPRHLGRCAVADGVDD